METPKLKAPPGACDTHIHIYEARYAFAPTAIIKPPPAPLSRFQDAAEAALTVVDAM